MLTIATAIALAGAAPAPARAPDATSVPLTTTHDAVPDAAPTSAAPTSGSGTGSTAPLQDVPHPSRKPSPPGTSVPITANPRLFGDWGGILPRLAEKGIVPTLSLVGEFAASAAGSRRNDAALVWQINAGITTDLRKAVGLPGTFQLTITKREGPLLERLVGVDLLQFSQGSFGRGRIWRLTDAFWQDKIGPVDLKLGRVSPGDDFNAARGDFMSLYLVGSATGHIASNIWYNFPVSQWGGRALYSLAPNRVLAVGLYQVDPRNIDPLRGFTLRTNGGVGILLPVEMRFLNPLGRDRPGIIKGGFYYSNAQLPDVAFDISGRPQVLGDLPRATDRRHWGVFGNIQQTFVPARADGSGAVTAIVNATWTTSGVSNLYGKIAAGVAITGVIPSRPTDELALGIGVGRISDHLTRRDEALRTLNPDAPAPRRWEQMVELYYGINVAKGFAFRPNVQVWRHPGGHPDAKPFVVLGAKTVINL